MEELARNGKRRMRFTLRETLLVMVIVALALGWNRSQRDAKAEIRRLSQRLMGLHFDRQFGSRRGDLMRDQDRRGAPSKTRVLSELDLKGANLRGVSLSAGQEPAFQKMIFDDCDLRDATLTAGVSSFQLAQFKRALLAGAKFTGGGASFQGSSFAGADVRGAKLIGGSASYQAMDIDAARFEGADLSALATDNLASCHFETPPTYDDATKFPAGFDPKLEGWKRAEAQPADGI